MNILIVLFADEDGQSETACESDDKSNVHVIINVMSRRKKEWWWWW